MVLAIKVASSIISLLNSAGVFDGGDEGHQRLEVVSLFSRRCLFPSQWNTHHKQEPVWYTDIRSLAANLAREFPT